MNEADGERDGPGGDATPGKVAASKPEAEAEAGTGPSDARAVDIQAYIGQQLRAVFEDVAKQPVPDRFLDLMRQLDAK